MKSPSKSTFTLSLVLCLASACGGDDGQESESANSDACGAEGRYVPFKESSFERYSDQVRVHKEIVALAAAAVDDDGNLDPEQFEDAEELYRDDDESGGLRAAVKKVVDRHLTGAPEQGERLDATILAAFALGKNATTPREAKVAKQWVDKSLQEYFFLAIYARIAEPSLQRWDEAAALLGTGLENDEDDLYGIAVTAFDRDSGNGTDLRAELFNGLLDGACILDEALEGEDSSQDPADIAGLTSVVEELDATLQRVFAYSIAYEAAEIREVLESSVPDSDELAVEATELAAFFLPLERIMRERGGAAVERADVVADELALTPAADGVPDPERLEDTTWETEVDPVAIQEAMEEQFNIEIRG